MKNMKKIASLLLVLVMVFALAAPALATEVTINLPSDQIEGAPANVSETYRAYKIFDADVAGESDTKPITNPTGTGSEFDHVAYTIRESSPFYNTINGFTGITLTVIDETEMDNKVYHVSVDDTFSAADLAKALQAVVNAEGFEGEVAATGTAKVGDPAHLSLQDGYFLIVGSLGSNAILDTVGAKDMTITTKNNLPTIEKETPVIEGQKIGDSIPYTITVHAKPGATKYVVHDTMGVGLTFNDDVEIAGLTKGTDYTVETADLGDDCTFHVSFTKAYLDGIDKDTDIVIKYSATINDEATLVVDTTTNKAHLDYGDDAHTDETEDSKTETPLYSFDLAKTTSDDELLADAVFELRDANDNLIPLVAVGANTYRPAILSGIEEDPADSRVNSITTNDTSVITFTGFGKGTYQLVELEAPDGYNALKAPATITIEDSSDSATMDGTTYVFGGVQVVNYTGAELPSTGGIGTTLFYIVGGLLIVGAAVLLITKKRVSGEQ